jgi:hypothetical protein
MNVPSIRDWQEGSRLRLRLVVIEVRPDPDPPERLGRDLRRLNADFCLIQNVAVPFDQPWLARLAAEAGAYVVSGPNLVLGNGVTGLALLTRQPPSRKRFADLSLPPMPANGAMDLDFEIDGNTVRIVAARLGTRPDEHGIQVENLYTVLTRRPRPALILGRFSASDLRLLASGRKGGRLPTGFWSSRLRFAREEGYVRIGSFPLRSLDAAPLLPPTPSMIGFEVSAPVAADVPSACRP